MDAIGVQVDGVSKRFAHRVKGEIYAARDVRLDVGPGEFLTLLGPSGCGKTTTLRMIAGFEMPDSGRIRFGGQDVTALPANQRNIGFVFQNYALFPHLSVFENVAYGLRVRGQSAESITQSVAEVLALVGLTGYEQQFSGQLSGGEQQRVALARAIVIHPRVLLFTTVYVTHDQEEAMAVSDRIAVMNQGSVIQIGSAEDLYHRPASPFVAQFVGRVNLLGGRVVEIAGDTARIEMLGSIIAAKALPGGIAPGDAVQLVLRPEAIEVERDGTARGRLQATVVSRTFLGEKIEYVLRCGDATLQIVRYNAGPGEVIAEGATVSVRLVEDAVAVLPGGSP